MINKETKVLLISIGIAISGVAHSTTITSMKDLTGNHLEVDFSQFNSEHYHIQGPVQIGGLIDWDITANSPTSSLTLWNGAYGLGGNGNWGLTSTSDLSMQGYIAIEPSDLGSIFIRFNDEEISGFGGYMNYVASSQQVQLRAFNKDDQLLETFNIFTNAPISTPGELNGGGFRGIQRGSADIASIEIFGSGIVFDNLAFVTSVPTPSTISLFLISGVGLMTSIRRNEISKNRSSS